MTALRGARAEVVALAVMLAGCGAPPRVFPRAPHQAAVNEGPKRDEEALLRALYPTQSGAEAEPTPGAAPPRASCPAELPDNAVWTKSLDGSGELWVRSCGKHASDLVIRGTTAPVHPTDYSRAAMEFGAGARDPKTIRLRVEGSVRPLRVWARALGPIGLVAAGVSGQGSAGDAVSVDVPEAKDEVRVEVSDIDRPNVRRGQTSPFVLVISDDPSALRAEVPDPREPVPRGTVRVRWDLRERPCGDYFSHCYDAWFVIDEGARFKVPTPLRGQTDCWPDGAGATCAGASGGTTYDFDVAPSGLTTLVSNAYSDGACPEGDCGTHTAELRFVLPPGSTIVPDPLGSFPPAPIASSK